MRECSFPFTAYTHIHCVARVRIIRDDRDAPFIEPTSVINTAAVETPLVAFEYLYTYYQHVPWLYLSSLIAISVLQRRRVLLASEFSINPNDRRNTPPRRRIERVGGWFERSLISGFRTRFDKRDFRMLALLARLIRRNERVGERTGQNRLNRASVKPRMIASNS